jgi:5-methylcytosine-specific restriction endonuclease McrA
MLLAEAADALLAGDAESAAEKLRAADMMSVHSYVHSVMSRESLEIHRVRKIGGVAPAERAVARMPSAAVTAAMFARDGYRCRFCGIPVVLPQARQIMAERCPGTVNWSGKTVTLHAAFATVSATLDHVVPHARGGTNDPGNLVTACWPCNFGRGGYLLEEVGIIDPRSRPPVVDAWDGLGRIRRLGRRATPPRAPVAQPERTRDVQTGEDAWIAGMDRISAGLAERLAAFVARCEAIGMSRRINKCLMLRIESPRGLVIPIGVEPTGDVQIPWDIGSEKKHFSRFAEIVAGAIPDAVYYETPKLWVVRQYPKAPVALANLLDVSETVLAALAALKDDLERNAS